MVRKVIISNRGMKEDGRKKKKQDNLLMNEKHSSFKAIYYYYISSLADKWLHIKEERKKIIFT